MKIEARFEQINGTECPVFFFPNEVERDKTIGAYSEARGYISASRAYMRLCRKPETEADFARIWSALDAFIDSQIN